MDGNGTKRDLRVTEIFFSIQGESTHAGRPCVFVRLTGCPLRCVWCDTVYAFTGGRVMSEEEIVRAVAAQDCRLVEVTGGEPLAQPGCRPLLARLVREGCEVLLETSGALSLEGIDPGVKVVMDLKAPDSGESGRNLWENLDRLKPGDEVKFVLASRRDYEWAREVVRARLDGRDFPIHFSPAWGLLEARALAGWILADRLSVRLQIQVHKILYGPEARGV